MLLLTRKLPSCFCLKWGNLTLVEMCPKIFKSPPVIEVQRGDCDLSNREHSKSIIRCILSLISKRALTGTPSIKHATNGCSGNLLSSKLSKSQSLLDSGRSIGLWVLETPLGSLKDFYIRGRNVHTLGIRNNGQCYGQLADVGLVFHIGNTSLSDVLDGFAD